MFNQSGAPPEYAVAVAASSQHGTMAQPPQMPMNMPQAVPNSFANPNNSGGGNSGMQQPFQHNPSQQQSSMQQAQPMIQRKLFILFVKLFFRKNNFLNNLEGMSFQQSNTSMGNMFQVSVLNYSIFTIYT